MNLNALKSFAPAVRRQLIEAVGRKLDYVLTADTPDLRGKKKQIDSLRNRKENNREILIENVAYTWFNRLAALRFLDAREWHPFGMRIITAANSSESQPEILRATRNRILPAELANFTDSKRLNSILDGHIPSNDPQGEVYRHLVLAACRFYHDLMPFLFEDIDDETELLLPDDLLTEHSIANGFRTEISDEDCSEVEILGWLYQFYISEKKDAVMARKKAVPSEDIPAVTQLFTPHWIVRYLVENSLGRLWLLNHPKSSLREKMPYYIQGEPETDFLKISRPEEIRLIDPACGSAHMLTYSFDLLTLIYEEEGYTPNEIPGLILKNNLFGLEICPRATQLAQFALVCKAREKSRNAFRNPVQPQVMCLQDIVISPDEIKTLLSATDQKLSQSELSQIYQFNENTSTVGALIKPVLDVEALATLRIKIGKRAPAGDLILHDIHRRIVLVLDQTEMLCQRYHVVMANPPYMGVGAMTGPVKAFAKRWFPRSKTDLFAMFIERTINLCVSNGFSALVTMHGWMFLSTFEELRRALIASVHLKSLLHIGPRGFDSISGEVVQTAAFVLENKQSAGRSGTFIRLVEGSSEEEKIKLFEEALETRDQRLVFAVTGSQLDIIPGSPIAYWVSEAFRRCFDGSPSLADRALFRQGMSTTDAGRFEREWHEIDCVKLNLKRIKPIVEEDPPAYWYPFNKGGSKRRWYGNLETVVRYERNGQDLLDLVTRKYPNISDPEFVIKNRKYFFLPAITYASIGTGSFVSRSVPAGCTYSVAGPAIFPDGWNSLCLLALLCSTTTTKFLEAINPTLGFQITDVGKIPISDSLKQLVEVDASNLAEEAISLARADWNNFETSWDFHDQPLLRPGLKGATLETSWRNWEVQSTATIRRMQELETENNRLFITAYGLQDELPPEVPEDQITLARADARKDMAAFLSYSVGCMMGRYSLDKPGFILADAGDTVKEYLDKVGKKLKSLSFEPDEDGIIPILDGEWFEDDVVARFRQFLRITFGDENFEENLRFLEEAIGKDIRKYFLSDFYKDHVQTFKKRPIYWMFQSPKKGFQCLIYMHRYNHDTVNGILNRYLREYLVKLRSRISQLEHQLASEGLSAKDRTRATKELEQIRKTIRECEEYERDVILPLAQQRIEIDLDDGVKVNYLKFGNALATIPGLAVKEEE